MGQSVHPVVRRHPWDAVQARLVPTRQGAPSGPECRPRRAQGSRVVASPLGAWPERSRQHWPIEGLRPATSRPAVSRPGLLLQGPALEPRGDFPLAPLESWGCPGLKPSWLLCDGGILLTPCSGSWRLPCCSHGAPLSSTSPWRVLSAGKNIRRWQLSCARSKRLVDRGPQDGVCMDVPPKQGCEDTASSACGSLTPKGQSRD